MYFKVENNALIEIEEADITEEGIFVGLVTPAELAVDKVNHSLIFDQRSVKECAEMIRLSKLETHGEYLFGTMAVPDEKNLLDRPNRMAYYIRKNLLLIVDSDTDMEPVLRRIAETQAFSSKSVGHFIYSLLEQTISSHYLVMDEMEHRISDMEELILQGISDDLNHLMIVLRKQMLRLDSFYSQLLSIGQSLQDNTADLFSPEACKYFKQFTERVMRMSENIHMLRDYSMQVREIYHSQTEMKQNQIMKTLTVVTTIFLPLSLLTSWYGMNFTNMPELTWKMGYPLVMVVSLVIASICILVFKKKSYF